MNIKDEKIEWFKDPKDFLGFSIRHNGKPNGYDVFGLLKTHNKGKEIWLLAGYLTMMDNSQERHIHEFLCVFVFSIIITLPVVLNLIVWR